MNRQTVLITGSSGFIGTNLTRHLLKQGCTVIALDRKAPKWSYPEYRYTDLPDAAKNSYDLMDIRGDVRDAPLLQEIFSRPVDYVIHLAALSTLQLGAEDCSRTMEVNAGGTKALLHAAAGCKKLKGFLYASTDKVYGVLQNHAYTETDALSPVNSPYDRSKAKADLLVQEWSRSHGIPGVILRFCNIYGPYDLQATRVIPGTIRAILEGRDCILRTYRGPDGAVRNFQRDFLYIDDLCETIWKVLEQLKKQGPQFQFWGEAFNLGALRCYPIDEVMRIIQKILGSTNPPKTELSEGLIEIPRQRMDYSRAAAVFGFAPKTPLEDGLRKTAAWWRQHLDSLAKQSNEKRRDLYDE